MRLIGHLPDEAAAAAFGDYLSGQGIANESEAGQEGWAVWIHSEDEWLKAKEMLADYHANPGEPKYRVKSASVPGAITPTPATEADKPVASSVPGQKVITISVAYRVGLLTMVMVGLCLAVQVLREAGYDEGVLRELFMTEIVFDGNYFKWEPGLREIFQGEFWRVFTPVMVHNDWLHLLLNMLWLLDLGSMIERRQGTGRLGLLIVVTAVLSNFGQYFLYDANFCGMSGVVYGLLGYVWMKGRFEPASGLYLQPHTLVMMLVWFFLCLVGAIPNIANGTHAVGLVVGTAWGTLSSKGIVWRRQS